MRPRYVKRQYSRGRWAIERERCQIGDAEIPIVDRPALPIGAAIRAVMSRLPREAESWTATLEAEWPAVAGAELARHTRPGRYDGRCLVVFVDSSPWLSELSRFARPRLLATLQQRYGADKVKTLALELDPEGGRGARGIRAGGRPPPAAPARPHP